MGMEGISKRTGDSIGGFINGIELLLPNKTCLHLPIHIYLPLGSVQGKFYDQGKGVVVKPFLCAT